MRFDPIPYCISIVVGMVAYAACGGQIILPGCVTGQHYCAIANVCCPSTTTCGTDVNRCPLGSCCPNGDAPGPGDSYSGNASADYDANFDTDPAPPPHQQPGASHLPMGDRPQ